MGEMVSRNELSNQLLKGVGGVGSGAAILALQSLLVWPIGLIPTGILILAGLVLSASQTQRKAGVVALGAGIITGAITIANSLLGPLVWLAGLGLIIAGGFSLYKFFKNMKART